MIPLSRVCLSSKKGGYVGVAQKKKNFEPKIGLGACPEARHTMLSTQTIFFLVFCHDGSNIFGLWYQNI